MELVQQKMKCSCWLQLTDLGTWMRLFGEDSKKEYVKIAFYLDIPLPGTEGRKKMFDINLKGLKVSEKVNW